MSHCLGRGLESMPQTGLRGKLVSRYASQTLRQCFLGGLPGRELEAPGPIAGVAATAATAAKLPMSGRVVKTRVSRFLSKLQLADRAQAVVHAWCRGVIRRDIPEG